MSHLTAMRTVTIELPFEDWTVTVSFDQDGRSQGATSSHGGGVPDAIDSLVLAQACAGFDLLTQSYLEALQTALEGCAANEADLVRQAEDMERKYGDYGEHPNLTLYRWQQAVAASDTHDSYWYWVAEQVTEKELRADAS